MKVLVIGDLMLDRYLWGQVSRISPEAPVPIVHVKESSSVVGGAANVAANIKGLGAEPFLFGVIGDDLEGKVFVEKLSEVGISSKFLHISESRRTTVKTRIVAHNQHVVRIDEESTESIDSQDEEKIFSKIENVLSDIHVVVISDYAKGLLTKNLLTRLITKSRDKNIPVLIDPKGKDFSKYQGASILTPNRREAAESCNLEIEDLMLEKKVFESLSKRLDLEALLITQGEKGMTLLQKDREKSDLEAFTRKVYDVTGAGDTVIACLATAIAAGADYFQAAYISNIAAGLVVEQVGTTAVNADAVKVAFSHLNHS